MIRKPTRNQEALTPPSISEGRGCGQRVASPITGVLWGKQIPIKMGVQAVFGEEVNAGRFVNHKTGFQKSHGRTRGKGGKAMGVYLVGETGAMK